MRDVVNFIYTFWLGDFILKKSNSSKVKIIVSVISVVAFMFTLAFLFVLVFNPHLYRSLTNTPAIDTSVNTPLDVGADSDMNIDLGADTDTGSDVNSVPDKEPDPEFTVTLSFAGDVIFADIGSFANHVSSKGTDYFFEKVRPIFEQDDFTIVNLENVFTDRALEPVEKDYTPAFWFKAPTSNINILSNSGVEGALISNNHIMDYGKEGYDDTVATISNAGLQYGNEGRIMYFEKNGFTVAVICSGMWGEYHTTRIINRIHEAEEKSDYQVVFFHGGTEKIHAPEEWKKNATHALVDSGADLVVGSHPHVLQPRETYNGVEIVYSMGNFCYAANLHPENRTVIYQVELTIDKDLNVKSSQSNIIPCYVHTGNANNYQPAVVDDNDEIKNKILDFMDGKIESPV